VGVLWMSTLVVLNISTTAEVPARVWGGFLTLSGLFVLYGVVYLVLRYYR
jgi:capsule polysaccharide export protein KpsE/RkpR